MTSHTVKSSSVEKIKKTTSALDKIDLKNVLIVDDSKTMRALLVNTLSGYKDFNLLEACDGSEALEIVKHEDIKMLFVDYNMPNMNGIEFIKNLRRIPSYKSTPVIMLTTESSESKIKDGYVSGATVYVTKPYEPSALVKIVDAMRYWHIK
ncbi:response regulator [bacterium]|nr:response regulator [bacterium]